MHTKQCFLFGAGGHAKVVYQTLQLQGIEKITVWDDDQNLSKKKFLDTTVCAPVQWDLLQQVGFVAIGDNRSRAKIVAKLQAEGATLLKAVHPLSSVSQYANLGVGSFVAAYAILAPGSIVGDGVIVNHASVIDHDCIVGDFTHIAPNATLGGGAVVGKGCLLGAGAVVLPGVHIANGVTVGAGAVVASDINVEGITVKGMPAK